MDVKDKSHFPLPSQKQDLETLCVNTIRFLSVDAVQKANNGHPGLPLDAALMAHDGMSDYMAMRTISRNWDMNRRK